jgi:transposase
MLIELVISQGESLTKTAKKLNIKLSTAKLILRKFRNTGTLFNKNMNARAKKC